MQGTPRQNAVAVGILLLVITALAVRWWASDMERRQTGPRHVAAGSDAAFVEFADRVYRLSRAGSVEGTATLAELGLDGTPVGLQALSDGSFLIGQLEQRAVLRCRLEAPPCERIGPADRYAIERQFKFYLDEAGNRLYLTDTSRHRLLVQDLARNALIELSQPSQLRYPNGLSMDPQGRLLVADTNHHRVLAFSVDGDTAQLAQELAAGSAHGRRGHTWPTALTASADGRRWVLNADGMLTNADLVIYDASGAAQRRIALAPDADPLSVAALDGMILAADPTAIALYAVDADTGAVGAFGDAQWQSLLAQRAQRRAHYAQMSQLAMSALVIGLGLAILLAVAVVRQGEPSGTAQRPRPARPAALVHGVAWVPRDQDTLRKLRRLQWSAGILLATLPLMTVALLLWMYVEDKESWRILLREFDPLIGYALAGTVAAVAGALWLLQRMLKTGIGTDGRHLYFQDSSGRVVQAEPEQVIYTARLVSYGRVSIPLQLGNLGPALEPQAFYRDIHPLLSRARKVGELHVIIYQILNGQPAGWLNLALIAAGLLFLAFYLLH